MYIKKRMVIFVFLTIILFLLIVFPDISALGVSKGLVISSSVILPSLFPFMVCVFLIIKNQINIYTGFINKVLFKIFGQNFSLFFIFVLSMIGGYPVGAAMINEMYNNNLINKKTSNIMLTYCVNAGPAFIVTVVGNFIGSRKIGVVLLFSHIISSLILSLIFSNQLKKEKINYNEVKNEKILFFTNLTESIASACNSVIKICSFIIVFSVINSYLDYFFLNVPILKYITLFTEVTSAINKCKNVYIISFLLGFSGLSIWCQIIALCNNKMLNIKRFILGRITHGFLSALLTYMITKIFKINIEIFNNVKFNNHFVVNDLTLFVSMSIMLIVFVISIFYKNNSGKFINDVL